MTNIRLGLLLPASTILPVGRDFEKGVQQAFSDNSTSGIEIIKEFIGQGGVKQTEEAVNKLLNYEEVDMIAGIVSGKVLENIADKFLNKKKPFLASNLGGYIPDLSCLNNYIFINSYHLWQHAWAIGYWGVNTFGRKGMYIGSVYDAGYSFSNMFYEGMKAADPESEWSFSIPPMPEKGKLSDMRIIFPFLDRYQPDFVFATFCGEETTLFLNEFIKRGWHKKTKLLGLPFLLAPFKQLDDDITIYTSLPQSSSPEVTTERSFHHLGYQAGHAIAAAFNTYNGESMQEALLSAHETYSPGNATFLSCNGTDRVTIAENNITANTTIIRQQVREMVPAFSLKDDRLMTPTSEIKFGWMNPYLCI